MAKTELLRGGLFEVALGIYEISSINIKQAAVIQEQIDRLKEEGKTDDDVQELIDIRNSLTESAEKAFEEGYDAEYYARHGRERPKPLENGKIILKP